MRFDSGFVGVFLILWHTPCLTSLVSVAFESASLILIDSGFLDSVSLDLVSGLGSGVFTSFKFDS